jgi:hypothetical protein
MHEACVLVGASTWCLHVLLAAPVDTTGGAEVPLLLLYREAFGWSVQQVWCNSRAMLCHRLHVLPSPLEWAAVVFTC